MIKRETFEETHIKELQQMNRRDPQLVERVFRDKGFRTELTQATDLHQIIQ